MKIKTFVIALILVGAGLGCDRANADANADADAMADAVVTPCEQPESVHESEVAALSNVEVYRGPLDMGGARVVGCLHNRSEEPLEKFSLFYKKIGVGGGGGLNLEFGKLKPGETTRFTTKPIEWDQKEARETGLEGYKIADVGSAFNDNYELDSPIELTPTAERPPHNLDSKCAELDPEQGEGDFRLSHVQYEPVKLIEETELYVVGCITNRSDQPIATDDRIAKGGYKIDARHNYASGGGIADLVVEEPIPAGKSALFVYSNTFDEEKSELSIEPEGGSAVTVD